MSASVGAEAPDFTLQTNQNTSWKLSDHRGKVVALIFYPKDETPVCTAQMCSIRDNWKTYQSSGAEVVGISMGSVDSHQKFAAHHNLPQTLLADEKGAVATLYDQKSFLGTSKRAVVVIDKQGIVRYTKAVLPVFRPSDDEVLAAIRAASS